MHKFSSRAIVFGWDFKRLSRKCQTTNLKLRVIGPVEIIYFYAFIIEISVDKHLIELYILLGQIFSIQADVLYKQVNVSFTYERNTKTFQNFKKKTFGIKFWN